MSLTAKPGKTTPPIEAGTYQAVCYQVVDLGTQYSEYWQKYSPKVIITWEIPELRIEYERDGEQLEGPRVISKTYTNVLHEKSNLSKDLISWRGRPFTEEEAEGFNITNVLGANCLLGVINTKKEKKSGQKVVYANVSSVSKLMANMQSMKSENEPVSYEVESGIDAIPDTLPDWIIDLIKKCEEFNPDTSGQRASNQEPIAEEDIPF